METTSETKHCPLCRERILRDAIKCKHCGSMISSIEIQSQNSEKSGSLWLSIVSLITGIFAIVITLNDGEWDKESIEAFIGFVTLSLGFGIFSLVRKLHGLGMAIAGVVLSSLAILIAISD